MDINKSEFIRDINNLRKLYQQARDIRTTVNYEITRVNKKHKIPAKIIRKLFLSDSVLEQKHEEDQYLPLIHELNN